MIVNILRLLVPAKARIVVGVWLINRMSCCWPLLYAYLRIMHGKVPRGMGLQGNHCYMDYYGRRILAPKNTAGVFLEIFQDKVYEQVWSPQPGDTVLDIGAYVGMFAVKASHIVGSGGEVIAIEPCHSTFSQLEENCSNLENISLVNKAVMDYEGDGRLYSSASAAANSMMVEQTNYEVVKVDTVDSILAGLGIDHIDFVKMDAEGSELAVLKGAARLLENGTKLAIAAYHTVPYSGSQVDAIERYLRGIGYSVTKKKGLRSYLYARKGN